MATSRLESVGERGQGLALGFLHLRRLDEKDGEPCATSPALNLKCCELDGFHSVRTPPLCWLSRRHGEEQW